MTAYKKSFVGKTGGDLATKTKIMPDYLAANPGSTGGVTYFWLDLTTGGHI